MLIPSAACHVYSSWARKWVLYMIFHQFDPICWGYHSDRVILSAIQTCESRKRIHADNAAYVRWLFLYCINQPKSRQSPSSEASLHPCQCQRRSPCTYQSKPSSRPSPLVAQLPLTLHCLPFSCPANPSFSDISPALNAPSTSCLLAKTSTGTDLSSSSDNIVKSSLREVACRDESEESIT